MRAEKKKWTNKANFGASRSRAYCTIETVAFGGKLLVGLAQLLVTEKGLLGFAAWMAGEGEGELNTRVLA
jgi:hypothetical protein